MSWIETTALLGNLGEFVGSVAVLVTLLYLATQVKQGREAIQRNQQIVLSQVHQARTDTRVNLNMALASIETPAMHQALHDATKVNDLTEEERAKLNRVVSATIAVVDNVLYQDELGLIDSEALVRGSQIIEAQFRTREVLEAQIPLRIRKRYEHQLAAG